MENLTEKNLKKIEKILEQEKRDKKKGKRKGKKKKRKQIGFSEKLVLGILYFSAVVVVLSIYYIFKYQSDDWCYVLQAIERVGIAAVGFFIWKAKNENVPRILNNPNFNLEQFEEELREEIQDEYRNLDKGGNY